MNINILWRRLTGEVLGIGLVYVCTSTHRAGVRAFISFMLEYGALIALLWRRSLPRAIKRTYVVDILVLCGLTNTFVTSRRKRSVVADAISQK